MAYRLLQVALVVFGAVMILLYPLAVVLAVLARASGIGRAAA